MVIASPLQPLHGSFKSSKSSTPVGWPLSRRQVLYPGSSCAKMVIVVVAAAAAAGGRKGTSFYVAHQVVSQPESETCHLRA